MFSHFQATLLSACDVLPLNAGEDYRRLMAAAAPPLLPLGGNLAASAASLAGPPGATSAAQQPPHPHASYFFPLGPAADAALETQWRRLVPDDGSGGAAAASPAELPVMFGRTLRVERAAGGAAWFSFEELCARPLGPADYLAVAATFHTVFLAGVPALSMQVRQGRVVVRHRCRGWLFVPAHCFACRQRIVAEEAWSWQLPSIARPTLPSPPAGQPPPCCGCCSAGPRPGSSLHHAVSSVGTRAVPGTVRGCGPPCESSAAAAAPAQLCLGLAPCRPRSSRG